ncbi:hypothetical protein, conserved [Leishmania tarentolae]|uniref:Uncharacterized protein n=1 Tax=Leishmania tarentolae TaxID=5689 RepID=A0A640KML9_LEITA|nr:hypothetical protein, conserved [Leishmania tarentolae]
MESSPLLAADPSLSSPSITSKQGQTRIVGTQLSTSMTHDGSERRLPASASQVAMLTRSAVKKLEQEMRQEEEHFDPSYSEDVGRRASRVLTPSGAGDTSGAVGGGRGCGEEVGEDSDDDDVYNAQIVRRIRTFLDSIRGEEFTCNPSPVCTAHMDANGEGVDEEALLEQRLEQATVNEIRTIAAEAQRELLVALNDAVTLAMDLTEMSEDAAVLERAVGDREETIEVLKMQLSIAEEYNDELCVAKKEALRKLSDANTEIALLSQRNATLSKKLQEKELELNTVRSANASAHASLPVSERRDQGTITTAELHSAPITAPAVAGAPNHGHLFAPSSSAQHCQLELDEMLWKLQHVCDTLQSTLEANADLDEQLQQLTIGARESKTDAAACVSGSSDADISHVSRERCDPTDMKRMLRRRREDVAHYTNSLESDIRMLWGKLQAGQACSCGVGSSSAGLCRSVTKAEAASRLQPAGSSGSAFINATPSEGQGGSGDCSGPADSNLALLQRQLDRAQAEARRLESELNAAREKSKRQSATEKKLLDNIAYLTRKLRDREALDRETRLQRLAEQRRTRGDSRGAADCGGALLCPHHLRHGDSADVRDGVSRDTDDVCGEGAPTSVLRRANRGADAAGVDNAVATVRRGRANSKELRQRREVVFAALREAQKAGSERRSSVVEGNTQRNSDG